MPVTTEQAAVSAMLGSLLTALGFLTGISVFVIMLAAEPNGRRHALPFAAVSMVSGVVGAKLSQWAVSAPHPTEPEMLSIIESGRTILGGILFGWIGAALYKRHLHINVRSGTAFALAVPAGETIGRLGCFVNGCCFGSPSNVAWAVFQHGARRHPAQLYSAGAAMLLFFVVLLILRRARTEIVFPLFLIIYSATRFCLEFFRDSQPVALSLSVAQWVCIIVAIALVGIAYARIHSKNVGEEALST